MPSDKTTGGTPRGECKDCGDSFALKDVCPDDMACPECGSRDWVNEPRCNDAETERDKETDRTVPTPAEDEITGTLKQVAGTGEAQCRLCDHVVQGDSFGEIFEKLAEHGEEAHDWDDRTGWSP